MDTANGLHDLAEEFEGHARALFPAARRLSGHPVARPSTELARSVAYCVIALHRLSESGIAAWTGNDLRFPPHPDDPAQDESDSPDPFTDFMAEFDLITCLIAADMVLEDLAYAELIRRGKAPKWTPGREMVPPMWPRFMEILDGLPADPMTESARYLDVTLAHARDVLVAHRDPTVHHFTSFTSAGHVTLTRVAVDRDREAAAAERVRALAKELVYVPHGLDARILLDQLVSLSWKLDKDQRAVIRTAYRYAGFESPPLGDVMRRLSGLLRRSSAPAPRGTRADTDQTKPKLGGAGPDRGKKRRSGARARGRTTSAMVDSRPHERASWVLERE